MKCNQCNLNILHHHNIKHYDDYLINAKQNKFNYKKLQQLDQIKM